MGKIANRQSLATSDGRLKSQPFSLFSFFAYSFYFLYRTVGFLGPRIARLQIASDTRFGSRDFAHLRWGSSGCEPFKHKE